MEPSSSLNIQQAFNQQAFVYQQKAKAMTPQTQHRRSLWADRLLNRCCGQQGAGYGSEVQRMQEAALVHSMQHGTDVLNAVQVQPRLQRLMRLLLQLLTAILQSSLRTSEGVFRHVMHVAMMSSAPPKPCCACSLTPVPCSVRGS